MVDIQNKNWNFHEGNSSMKQKFYETHLPPLKVAHRQPTDLQLKTRQPPSILPSVGRKNSSNSILDNPAEKSSQSFTTNHSAAREAAQRFILRNQLAKFSHESSTSSFYQRRKTLYQHVQAKINTGLQRSDTRHQLNGKSNVHRPFQPLNWFLLKKDLSEDKQIVEQAQNIQFNTGENYAERLTSFTDLIRSKIKTNLATERQHFQTDRYKIVVHLTVIPRQSIGLNVASRCLWNARTDNSLTLKLSGVDCDILIIVFLCYIDDETL